MSPPEFPVFHDAHFGNISHSVNGNCLSPRPTTNQTQPTMSEDPSPQTVFDEAVEILAPSERTAYLDRACGEDAELRCEVESLLAAYFAAGSFMELPVSLESMAPGEQEGDQVGGVVRPSGRAALSRKSITSPFLESVVGSSRLPQIPCRGRAWKPGKCGGRDCGFSRRRVARRYLPSLFVS